MPRPRSRPVRGPARPRLLALAPARTMDDRVVGLATWGLLGYLGLTAAWFVQIFLTEEGKTPRHAVADVVGLAACLPVIIALVLQAARRERSPASWWLLAALAVLFGAILPAGGVLWLFLAQFVAGGILLVFPVRWALPLFAASVLMPALVTRAEHQGQWSTYLCVKTLEGGLSLAVLVWLVRTLRQAHAARIELAGQAIIAERLRIDAALGQEISAALARIVALGDQAALPGDAERTAAALQALVAFSRQTLTLTRRLLASYQQTSAAAELQTAVTLLAGAGISARLQLPDAALPAVLSDELRAQLRGGLARMLATDDVRHCVIALTLSDPTGDCALAVTRDRAIEVGVR